ncbi:MAG: TRAP transporter large permease subunit [Thermodesulfobacteriota bacterium]
MQKLLESLRTAFDTVLTATGYIGGALILLSAAFITYDTMMRWVFRITSDWIYEYTVYMIGAASCLSTAYVLREKGHINVDFLVSRLSGRTRGILNLVSLIFSSGICVVLAWSALQMLLRAVAVKSVSNTLMETPLWIPQSFLPLGFAMLSLQAIRMTVHEAIRIPHEPWNKEPAKIGDILPGWLDHPSLLLTCLFTALGAGGVLLAVGGPFKAFGVLILLFAILTTGTPIFLAMALTGGVAFLLLLGGGIDSQAQLAPLSYSRLMSSVLTAIPYFVVGAGILTAGGCSDKLFTFFQQWLPGVRGKLAMVTVLACAMFAACTGSSPACAAAFSFVAIPAMLARNYDKRLAYGVVAGGGTLGPMIPPSIAAIIFAEITGLSVGALLISGIMPGLLIAACFAAYIIIKCWGDSRYDSDLSERGIPFKQRLDALWEAIPVFFVPVIVVVGIYSGIATPTESAAQLVVYAVIIAFATKGVTVRTFSQALLDLLKTSTMIYSITFAANVMSAALVMVEAPQGLSSAIANTLISPWIFIILVMLLLFVFGCFLDPISILLITVPIFYPVVKKFGFDGIWYYIIFNINMEVAMLTPPVGMNLFVLAGATKDRFEEIVMACIPFVVCLLIAMVLVMIFPQIATWLPGTIR